MCVLLVRRTPLAVFVGRVSAAGQSPPIAHSPDEVHRAAGPGRALGMVLPKAPSSMLLGHPVRDVKMRLCCFTEKLLETLQWLKSYTSRTEDVQIYLFLSFIFSIHCMQYLLCNA